MQNKLINRKENLISIVITLLFVFGFLILINYNTSITGLSVLDNSTVENITSNETLIENETIETNITSNETVKNITNKNLTENNTQEENSLFEFEIQPENYKFNIAFSGSGAGTLADPYQITNCTQLQEMNKSTSANYSLMDNIDCSDTVTWNSDAGFEPIGNSSVNFTGTFDGRNHTITELYINRSSTTHIGLFGYVDSGGKIKNVGLVNVNITGGDYAGGLVGYNDYGTITDSYSTGSVNGGASVGGLVGYNDYGTITDSYSTGSVTGSGELVGGLVGYNYYGSINNTYATGSVSGRTHVGGLLGRNYIVGTITDSYSTGTVTGSGTDEDYVGGLAGTNEGIITDSYSTGTVTGSSYTAVGGLLGYNYGTIDNTYATGSVIGDTYVGGLVGHNGGTITDSYATGTVIGVGSNGRVGGLAGFNGKIIKNSYSTGNVTGIGNYVGGLVGWIFGMQTITTNTYWNNKAGNPSVCIGVGSGTCTAIQDDESYFYDVDKAPMLNWSFPPWDDFCDNKGYTPLALENITNVFECRDYIAPIVNLQFPKNNTETYARQISFTFNVTDPDNSISECSLWLNIDGLGFDNNKTTDTSITQTVNQTFNKSFTENAHTLYWKVGCTADDSTQVNSTAYYLNLITLPEEEEDKGIISQPAPAPVPVPEPAPAPEPEPAPAPTQEQKQEQVQQQIGLPGMNLDPGFSNVLKNLFIIDIEEEPRIPEINIQNKTLLINLENETQINIDFTAKKPTILITETTALGIKPEIPSNLLRNILILIFIIASLFILYLIIQYLRLIPKKKKPKKIKLPPISILKKGIIDVQETNKLILRFNKLSELIKLNINQNKLNIASKQYQELLTIYQSLISKLSKEDQSKSYSSIKETYSLLKDSIKINYLKKKLKK